jgi:hypothetical protein
MPGRSSAGLRHLRSTSRRSTDEGWCRHAQLEIVLVSARGVSPGRGNLEDQAPSHRPCRDGVIDPNCRIRGGGAKLLRQTGIDVALFLKTFANEIEAMNSAFEREHELAAAANDEPPRLRGFIHRARCPRFSTNGLPRPWSAWPPRRGQFGRPARGQLARPPRHQRARTSAAMPSRRHQTTSIAAD